MLRKTAAARRHVRAIGVAALAYALAAACALPAPLGLPAQSTAQPGSEAAGPGASSQIVGAVPTETPEPPQQRNTGSTGPIPTPLPFDATPLPPDVPPLSLPPTPTLLPVAAAAATANAATAVAGATQAAGTATALPVQEVRIENFAFSPATLSVKPGSTVLWLNFDPATHQVAGGDFDSGRLYRGQYWAVKYEKPGQYTYYCSFHPTMRAQITVTEPDVAQRFTT